MELAKLPKSVEEIIASEKDKIKQSRDYVSIKRESFRTRLKLFNNQRKQKDKIGDTTIFNLVTTLMAVYYTDEMQVAFSGRELGDTAQAANIEYTAKFDHDEMGMDEMNYLVQWDRLFFGVGIRIMAEWNKRTSTPAPKSMDAMSWLPDPSGYMSIKKFRHCGFEVEYARHEMTEEKGFFNLDMLRAKNANSGSELDETRAALTEAQNLDDVLKNTKDPDTEIFQMIDWFTIIVGDDGIARKYLLTFDYDVKTLFKCEEIEAITEDEKADPTLVTFPLALNYYSPTRHDPFGVSVCDLAEDKQRAKSVFKNLRIAAAKAGLYPMYLYNKQKILNRRDLDFAFNKFIAVAGDVDQGTIQPLQKSPLKLDEILNSEQSLDRDVEIAVGADATTQGVTSAQAKTLGEVEQTQANANLRFMLGSRINGWGEKAFWGLWYRLYKQNFQSASKKIVRIKSAIGNQYISITRKDFITKKDPDIIIGSKLEMEKQRSRDKVAYASIMPMIAQDPTKPTVSKRFAERRLLKLYGLTPEEISVISPDTVDESRAKMENELLQRNEKVEIEIGEDHQSHNVIHAQAEDTVTRNAHIEAHKQAYIKSGQYKQDKQAELAMLTGGGNAQGNIAANQISNQNANLNNSNKQPEGVKPEGTNQ